MKTKKQYIIINKETKKAYAQRDTFMEAVEVAKRKINGFVMTRTDWEAMTYGGEN
uniref:Uncharacterized protein n=1 Tax=Enterococcus phage vB_EfaS_SZ1 TaxID=3161157 RepID=A0AAU8EK45_9CAUD